MTDAFEMFDTVTAGGQLLLVLIVIGVAYVFTVSPVLVLSGRADSTGDYAAGAAGMAFWAFAAASFAGAL